MPPAAMDRRTVLTAGGLTLAAAAVGARRVLYAVPERVPTSSAPPAIESGFQAALAAASAHFWDPAAQRTRPTSGGGANFGLIDYAGGPGALWQRHAFTNVLFNQWRYLGDTDARERVRRDWAEAVSQDTKPAWTPAVLAGRDSHGLTTYTFDDCCWQATYLMQAHQADPSDARPLGFMVDTIVNSTRRYLDPDAASNPPVTFVERSPNYANLDYGLGSSTDAAGRQRFAGPAFAANSYGSLYTLKSNSNYAQYGKISSAFESMMALCALYGHQALGHAWLRDYAVHAQRFVRERLLTPDPDAVPDDPEHTPTRPAMRKARYLVECELFLERSGNDSPDPNAAFLKPKLRWFGKPVRNLDSTYLGGAFAFCVLSARLYRLTGQDIYRQDALNTAGALASPQGYGRTVDGSVRIGNTRDPHIEGLWAVRFAAEVLTLPGAPVATGQALIDTAAYMVAHGGTPDGYLTADWAGPEENPNSHSTRWDQDWAHPKQIMVTSESLSMMQAGVLQARQAARSS